MAIQTWGNRTQLAPIGELLDNTRRLKILPVWGKVKEVLDLVKPEFSLIVERKVRNKLFVCTVWEVFLPCGALRYTDRFYPLHGGECFSYEEVKSFLIHEGAEGYQPANKNYKVSLYERPWAMTIYDCLTITRSEPSILWECTEEEYYEALGAVPPLAQVGNSFIQGEAAGNLLNSDTVYCCFSQLKGRYYARNLTRQWFKEAPWS